MDIDVVEVARDVDSDLNIVFVDLVWVVALAEVVEGDNDDEVLVKIWTAWRLM